MARLILLNKPFQVLSQFTDTESRSTLADYIKEAGLYPAGRLDYDSEGLILLTDSGQLQHQISHPRHKQPKTYWVQVEGMPTEDAIAKLRRGVVLNDGPTLPAKVQIMDEPETLWPRNPPIRERKNIPTTWISITITEGRNRQVRRMTAAAGHPTLRLIRSSIGPWVIDEMQPGQWREEQVHVIAKPDKAKPTQRRLRKIKPSQSPHKKNFRSSSTKKHT